MLHVKKIFIVALFCINTSTLMHAADSAKMCPMEFSGTSIACEGQVKHKRYSYQDYVGAKKFFNQHYFDKAHTQIVDHITKLEDKLDTLFTNLSSEDKSKRYAGLGVINSCLLETADAPLEHKRKYALLKKILGHGIGCQFVEDAFGETALIKAAKFSDAQCIQLLIDAKSDVNFKSRILKETALHRAAEFGNIAAVKQLVAAQADICVRDSDRTTALHHARRFGQTEVFAYLQALHDQQIIGKKDSNIVSPNKKQKIILK